MPSLADLVLAIHLAFVTFVVGGLAAIWVGAALGRPWAASRTFRMLHLAAIGVVVAESLLGIACPLTAWEDALRGHREEAGFIARALRALLYWNLPGWVFTLLYCAFGALVAWTWLRVPPRPRPPRAAPSSSPRSGSPRP
jgi:hypothetical protein